MQIHELNNYNGDLDSGAYFAIDDGNDTGKVSAEKLLESTNNEVAALEESLNSRIDNIIGGGDAPSAAEVTDARQAFTNRVFPSLGAAIRWQAEKAASIAVESSERIFDFDLAFYYSGYVNENGQHISNANFYATDWILVNAGDSISYGLYGNTSAHLLVFGTDFTVIPPTGLINNIVGVDKNTIVEGTFIAPSVGMIVMCCANNYTGAKKPYIKFNGNDSIPEQLEAYDALFPVTNRLVEDFNDYVKANSRPITESVSATWTPDSIINVNTGAESAAGSTSWVTSNFIPVTPDDKYTFNATMRFNNALVAFYDENQTFISSIAGNTGTAIATNVFQFTDYEVVIPQNAAYMRIGYYAGYTHTFEQINGYELIATESAQRWNGKKWVCIGDSLTADNAATTKHYFDYVSEATGISPVNMGANGTGYAKSSGSGDAFYDRISSVPLDADVVTIFGSFNDITSGLIFGDVDDTGTDSIAGCINTTISNLQARIPLVNLGIVAPTPWDTTQPNFVPTSNSYKYWNLLKSICERRSIPFLDLWHCSNLRPWDADFRLVAYSKDGGSGTHPDENGHKLIAPRFEWFLSSLLL